MAVIGLFLVVASLFSSSWGSNPCTPQTCTSHQFSYTGAPAFSLDTVQGAISVTGVPVLPTNAIISLQTDVQFDASFELDMTLTSPAGTTIRITTDNGGAEFPTYFFYALEGVVWIDSAPSVKFYFQLPIVDLLSGGKVLELAPEQLLSSFLGEDPNGDWILTVVDDELSAYYGNFLGWSITFDIPNEAPSACNPNPCQNGGVCAESGSSFTCNCTGTGFYSPTCGAILTETFTIKDPTTPSDGDSINPTELLIAVSGIPNPLDPTSIITIVMDADVDLASDLIAELSSPSSNTITIVNQRLSNTGLQGGSQPFVDVTWRDDGTPVSSLNSYETNVPSVLAPEQPLSTFLTEDPNGRWKLKVYDAATSPYYHMDTVILFRGWSISFQFPVPTGPLVDLDLFTRTKSFAPSTSEIFVTFEGSTGESGPHSMGTIFNDHGKDSIFGLQLSQDVGDIWGIRLTNGNPADNWGVSMINLFILGKSIPFGIEHTLTDVMVLEAPLKMTVTTKNQVGAGTRFLMYCTFHDALGNKKSSGLKPGGFKDGAVDVLEIPFVNVGEITKITLGSFSLDDWSFDSIVIEKRGVVKTFVYDLPISRFNHLVDLFPV